MQVHVSVLAEPRVRNLKPVYCILLLVGVQCATRTRWRHLQFPRIIHVWGSGQGVIPANLSASTGVHTCSLWTCPSLSSPSTALSSLPLP